MTTESGDRQKANKINTGSVVALIKSEVLGRLRQYKSSVFIGRVLLTFSTRMAILVLDFVVSIITARYLGPQGRGILAVLATIGSTGAQFGNLGLHAANTYFVAKDRSLFPKIIGNTLWLSLTGGTLISLITFGILYFKQNLIVGVPIPLLIITLLAIPFSLLSLLSQNILVGIQRIKVLNTLTFASSVVSVLAAMVLLVWLGLGVPSLVVVGTIFTIFISLVVFSYLRTIEKNSFAFDLKLLKQMAGYGLKAYLAALFAFLVIRFDILMVNYFLGSGDVGIYSLTVNIADILYLLPIAVGTILFPQVSSMKEGGWVFTKKVVLATTGIMAGICLMMALVAKPFILFFYGEPFVGAASALLWLLPGVWALSTNTIFMNFFAGRGMPIIVVISPLTALAINVSLNFYFIPRFGINGAAVTSSAAYFLMLIASLIYLRVSNVRTK